jgi:hypothetical protein
MMQPRSESASESRRRATPVLDLPERAPVDETIMPAFNRSSVVGLRVRDSTFADRFDPGNNGIDDGGRD